MYDQFEGFLQDHRGMVTITLLVLIFGAKYISPLFSSLVAKVKTIANVPGGGKQDAGSIIQAAISSAINAGEVALAKKLMDLHPTVSEVKPQ